MGKESSGVVERAVRLFSDLDSELDKLEAGVRVWGKQLLEQADRLSSEAKAALLREARERAEEELRKVEEEASMQAENLLRSESERLKQLEEEFSRRREELVERALRALLPGGAGDER